MCYNIHSAVVVAKEAVVLATEALWWWLVATNEAANRPVDSATPSAIPPTTPAKHEELKKSQGYLISLEYTHTNLVCTSSVCWLCL